jgi:hypothetical protein
MAAPRTLISVGRHDFEEDDFARPSTSSSTLVQRTVGVRAGTQLDIVLCSNASQAFLAGRRRRQRALRVLRHHYRTT